MKRLALGLLVILANLAVADSSQAQPPETSAAAPGGGEKAPPAEAAPAPDVIPDLDLSEIPGLEEEGGPKPATAVVMNRNGINPSRFSAIRR